VSILDRLQAEHAEWLSKWPPQPSGVQRLGMCEEAAELLHACLKLEQWDLWQGQNCRHTRMELLDRAKDAVGDCTIYLCSFCAAVGETFINVCKQAMVMAPYDGLASRCALNMLNATMLSQHVSTVHYLWLLMSAARLLRIDYLGAVEVTWSRVKTRDQYARDR
jgi:hypothetical protein